MSAYYPMAAGLTLKFPTRNQAARCRPPAKPAAHQLRCGVAWCKASAFAESWAQSAARAGALCAALLLVAAPPALAVEQALVGPATVVDGDTLVVAGTRVRLFGIDAPETKQSCSRPTSQAAYSCGLEAKQALIDKIGGAPVRCSPKKSKDMYGRSVAVCSLVPQCGAAEDLNAWLVQEGHAVAYRQYSKAYVPMEDAARSAGRGIWAGAFEQPDQWRKENPRSGRAAAAATPPAASAAPAAAVLGAVAVAAPQPSAAAVSPPAGCLIKGNISGKGQRIYHVPGGRQYDVTKIDKEGERWFCGEAEAQAAGWRRAAA